MPIIPILSILNGLSVARIEVLLLPVASLVRLPDPTPSLQPHYELSSLLRVGPPQCSASVRDRKSTRLNSSHLGISYAVFCLKKKKIHQHNTATNNASSHVIAAPSVT